MTDKLFVHSTTSELFACLPNWNFQVISSTDAIKKFHQTSLPNTKKIIWRAIDKFKLKDWFAKIIADNVQSLNVAAITKINQPNNHLLMVQNDIAKQCLFSNCEDLILAFAQAKQLQYTISPMLVTEMMRLLQSAIQVYYLVLLLDNTIQPNYAVINAAANHSVPTFIWQQLSLANLLNIINLSKLDIKKIYENPTLAALKKINDLLGLPISASDSQKIQLFKASTEERPAENARDYPYQAKHAGEFFSAFLNQSNIFEFDHVLYHFAQNSLSPEFFAELKPLVLNQIKYLENTLETLQAISRQKNFILGEAQRKFVDNDPYPVLLVTTEKSNLQAINQDETFFISSDSLQIGNQIKYILTDTFQHQTDILTLLNQYGMYNVRVILFDDLVYCYNEKQFEKLGLTFPSICRLHSLYLTFFGDATLAPREQPQCDKTLEIACR